MNKISIVSATFAFVVGVVVIGCSQDTSSCKKDADCDGDLVCINQQCIEDPYGIPDDSDTTTEIDTGTSTIKDTYSDSNVDTVDTETETVDSESDTGECEDDPTVEDGYTCTTNCDCYSGHCDNGFCCAEGECCAEAADCNFDQCATAVCADAQCLYTTQNYACGQEDMAGSLCVSGKVCDGDMNCIAAGTLDCGQYAVSADWDCSGVAAALACYDSCTADNQDTRCIQGAICSGGICVNQDAVENGSVCDDDVDCLSGHCGDGFCCATGECCAQTSDCSDSCKTNLACGTNHQCFATNIGCGYEDNAGAEPCNGNSRCDGLGSCVDVNTCVDQGIYFGSTGGYECESGSIAELCRTTCSNTAQCADGAECVSGTCKVSDGFGCVDASDCASGRCNNGYCCDGGTCCADNSDCETPCTIGAVCNDALHNCEEPTSNESCGAQPDGCTGDNRCNGEGVCVATIDYCDGTGEDTYNCDSGQVVRDCRCHTDADCDDDDLFCNGTYECGAANVCDFTVRQNACPASTPCYDGVSCDEATDSCNGTNPCEALATECDSKICMLDGIGGYRCDPNAVPDVTYCDDGDTCNGLHDRCLGGICQPGGFSARYCYDGDPCTEDVCTDLGSSSAECNYDAVVVGTPCADGVNCYGSDPTCQWDAAGTAMVCVASDAVCDLNGVCLTHTCTDDFSTGGVDCENPPNQASETLNCGQEVTLTSASHFKTRVNFDYTGPGDGDTDLTNDCHPSDNAPFIGQEAILYVEADTESDMTAELVVTGIDPSDYGTLDFLLFDENASICNWATCTERQSNGFVGLSLPMDGMGAEFILDSREEIWAPTSVTIRMDCTP